MGREPANSASSTPHPCLCSLMNYSLSRYKLCSLAQTNFWVYCILECVFKHPLTPFSLPHPWAQHPFQPYPADGLHRQKQQAWDVGWGGTLTPLLYSRNRMLFSAAPLHLIIFPFKSFWSKEHLFKGIWATVFLKTYKVGNLWWQKNTPTTSTNQMLLIKKQTPVFKTAVNVLIID